VGWRWVADGLGDWRTPTKRQRLHTLRRDDGGYGGRGGGVVSRNHADKDRALSQRDRA